MKSFLLIAIAVLLFSCGDPKEYDMTFGDFVDKYTLIEEQAEEIYKPKRMATFDIKDSIESKEAYKKVVEEKQNYIIEKCGISQEDFDLLLSAQKRLKKEKARLHSMKVGEVIKMQKLVEGK